MVVVFLAKIGFIIKGYGGKSQYYNANVKPFVDLSIGLSELGVESVLFIDETEKHLLDKIQYMTHGNVSIIVYKGSDLSKRVKDEMPSHIMIDDNIEYMKRTVELKNLNIKIIAYVQYLYGVNTNKVGKRKKSMPLFLGSFFPWRFLTQRYRRLLKQFDYITPNSQTCGFILRQFYDVKVSGVVYPPVGVDMRDLIDPFDQKSSKSGILVFVGNIENDYFSRDLISEISDLGKSSDEPIKILAGSERSKIYFSGQGFEVYYKLPANELVKLFEESRITYVPTSYELFGHVGAESILCGTPVILDTYHPFLERFPMETGAVIIASPKEKIADVANKMNFSKIDIKNAKSSIINYYSAKESALQLLKAIDVDLNTK